MWVLLAGGTATLVSAPGCDLCLCLHLHAGAEPADHQATWRTSAEGSEVIPVSTTSFAGITMFRNLPRQMFGKVQSRPAPCTEGTTPQPAYIK